MPRKRQVVQSWSNARLLAKFARFSSDSPEVLVLTPTPRGPEEVLYLQSDAAHGRTGWHQFTLSQLASELARSKMAALGLAPISALAVHAIVARIAHVARRENELTRLTNAADFPGFATALSRTLADLRMAGIPPSELPGDIGLLLSRFQEELESAKLADTARIFELAIEAVRQGHHPLIGLPLALLDIPREGKALVDALMAASPDVFIATTGDAEEWSAEPQHLDPEPATTLDKLRRDVFEPTASIAEPGSGVEVFSSPGEGLECAEIARRILRMNVAFDRIAILLRNPDRYQPMVEEALRRACVPAYFSKGVIRPDTSGRAFLALLHCAAERCSASRFAEYLSLGQVPIDTATASDWEPADSEAQEHSDPQEESVATPYGWERLLVDASVIGGKDRWVRRLAGLEREFTLRVQELDRSDPSLAESQRKTLDRLRQLQNFALPLIELLDQLPQWGRWSEWIAQLRALARAALRHPEAVQSVLTELEPMGEVGPVNIDDVVGVLGERLRFLRREPSGKRWGRVFVGSMEEARGRAFDAVFVPGMAEGLFPQKALEDPLLLDDEKSHLPQGTLRELKLRKDQAAEERTRLRLSIAAAGERFIASYPRMDAADARPRVPSFYALEVPRATRGSLPELKDFESAAGKASQARLNWPAPESIDSAIDDAEFDLVKLKNALEHGSGARHLVEQNPHLARSLRARWQRWESPKWSAADGLIVRELPAQKALSGYRLLARPWSASSLEEYAACPYKFTLRGIFGLRPRDEAVALEQLDPITRGALFHEVQFELLGVLRKHSLLPLTVAKLPEALACADETLGNVAAKYAEDLAPAIPRVWASEMEDLRMDIRGWLTHVSRNDEEWEPWLFEYSFGLTLSDKRDPISSADPVTLAEGVLLKGSIDLVERKVSGASLRITDHKTGRPPETTPAIVGGGRALQPLLYGLAAQALLGQTVEQGRLFYATQRGGFNFTPIPIQARSREFLAKLLSNIDGAIEGGFLPAVPDKDACSICDYRVACGPYEELRVQKFKDRRDERLEPLFEIRGFA